MRIKKHKYGYSLSYRNKLIATTDTFQAAWHYAFSMSMAMKGMNS